MTVWFVTKYNWEDVDVYGPFSKQEYAADFIEHSEETNKYEPWWEETWWVKECEVSDGPEDKFSAPVSDEIYREDYCEKMQDEAWEKWKKEHPNALKDAVANANALFLGDKKVTLDNLKFGQEIQVPISKPKGEE